MNDAHSKYTTDGIRRIMGQDYALPELIERLELLKESADVIAYCKRLADAFLDDPDRLGTDDGGITDTAHTRLWHASLMLERAGEQQHEGQKAKALILFGIYLARGLSNSQSRLDFNNDLSIEASERLMKICGELADKIWTSIPDRKVKIREVCKTIAKDHLPKKFKALTESTDPKMKLLFGETGKIKTSPGETAVYDYVIEANASSVKPFIPDYATNKPRK